jgi:hypothetical protein
MEWEDKVRMVQLGNERNESMAARRAFQSFVLENIESFDVQAWDMFCNSVDIIINEMKVDIEFWKTVFSKIKTIDSNNDKLGMRSGMRIAMIQTICEEELHLS